MASSAQYGGDVTSAQGTTGKVSNRPVSYKRKRTLSVPNMPAKVPKVLIRTKPSDRDGKVLYSVSNAGAPPPSPSATPIIVHNVTETPRRGREQAQAPNTSLNANEPEVFIDEAFISLCIGCSPSHIDISKPSPTMQCEYCAKHYCLGCADISIEEYPVLRRCKSFHWFCPLCEGKAVKSISTDKDIESRCSDFLRKMESRIVSLEIDLTHKVSKAEIGTLVRSEIETTNIKELVKTEVSKSQLSGDDVKRLVQEEMEKNKENDRVRADRRSNIIVHNLPEPSSESELENVDTDSRAIECLITEHLRINCSAPTSIQRLGRKSEKP